MVNRDLADPSKTIIDTDFINKVISVRNQPNGNHMSVGDDHGKLRIFFHNMQSNEYITKGDYQLLTGPINAITWTDDS